MYNPVENINFICPNCKKKVSAIVPYKLEQDSNAKEDLYIKDRINTLDICKCKEAMEELNRKYKDLEFAISIRRSI